MKPLLAVSSPLASLCLSQIPLPSPSTAPHMATTMLWLCQTIPPTPHPGEAPAQPPEDTGYDDVGVSTLGTSL